MMHLGAPLLDVDWLEAVLLQVLPLTLPWEGRFPVITNPLMMTGYPLIPLLQIEPLVGGVGAVGATVAIVTVTPMVLTPLEEGGRKRMDF